MARAIWTGSLNFGLVNVPVALYAATKDKSIHFNQFEEGTPDRIRYRKVNERTGEEVESSRIVRGIDVGGGEYVILSDAELAAAEPERTRNIEITDFVDLDDIDPVYYRSTYYLGPQGEPATRAYGLLRAAMGEANKVAIATLVMRGKEYLVAVRPSDEVLALETMYFADEVRSPADEVPNLPGQDTFTDKELATAQLLIDAMASDWDPARYHDTYRDQLDRLVEEKRQGHEIVTELPPQKPAGVIDLMAALQASVKATRAERGADRPAGQTTGGTTARAKAATKAPAAKKSAAKRAPAKKSAAKATKATPTRATRRKAS
ncbi:MAG TPA: Ku protein [Acidimicrobiales bacterium]|nr:Ku protein [Acidimicrobiales bacterium]